MTHRYRPSGCKQYQHQSLLSFPLVCWQFEEVVPHISLCWSLWIMSLVFPILSWRLSSLHYLQDQTPPSCWFIEPNYCSIISKFEDFNWVSTNRSATWGIKQGKKAATLANCMWFRERLTTYFWSCNYFITLFFTYSILNVLNYFQLIFYKVLTI